MGNFCGPPPGRNRRPSERLAGRSAGVATLFDKGREASGAGRAVVTASCGMRGDDQQIAHLFSYLSPGQRVTAPPSAAGGFVNRPRRIASRHRSSMGSTRSPGGGGCRPSSSREPCCHAAGSKSCAASGCRSNRTVRRPRRDSTRADRHCRSAGGSASRPSGEIVRTLGKTSERLH